jgi:hypothetical protein
MDFIYKNLPLTSQRTQSPHYRDQSVNYVQENNNYLFAVVWGVGGGGGTYMQSVAKCSYSLAAKLCVVTAEFLEGRVDVTPFTILSETMKKFRNVDGWVGLADGKHIKLRS